MKIVIIEDEPLTAEDLAEILLGLPVSIEVIKILSSVEEGVRYFISNAAPDLIFSDIQLGDGTSFDIFRQTAIDVPVIFCTAHSTYGVDAFKNNGIDYVLKPFNRKSIKAAVDKYNNLRTRLARTAINFEKLFHSLPAANLTTRKASSLLVTWKNKIIPVRITDIALFFVEYKTTQLVTQDNQKHVIAHTLEELEELCGDNFFRANRQFLINRTFVAEAHQHLPRKLLVKLSIENKYEIVISKNRIPEFLSWLRS